MSIQTQVTARSPADAAPRRMALILPLANRNFRLLWMGENVSLFGDQFYFIALPWLIFQMTGSMMAFGTIFYAIGFLLFGFFTTFILFALNIVIITIGEMIVVPTSQSLVAGFAPDDMRGRYMAIAGLSWAIPSTIGPGLAGYIMDNYNPNLVWYIGGALCGLSVLAYYALHLRLGSKPEFSPEQKIGQPLPASTD